MKNYSQLLREREGSNFHLLFLVLLTLRPHEDNCDTKVNHFFLSRKFFRPA